MELETRKFVTTNKNLFEDIAKGYVQAKDIFRVQYSALNYVKLIDQMIEFLAGYQSYTESDTKKYEGKVITITRNFYDKMFDDPQYRHKIQLAQYGDIIKETLKKTKELQDVLETYNKRKDISSEMHTLVNMTNNQYKKLAKVCRDDMKIYLWLSTMDNKHFAYRIDDSTRKAFNNAKTPVMHKVVKK